MKVKELIAILQTMPQDAEIEVNDNNGGSVWSIEQVDHFPGCGSETDLAIIRVNC